MALAQLLANFTICCTGLEEETKAAVQKKTEALGGRYSSHLTKECTHLIAAGTIAKSSKYKSALKYKIPVVKVAWIDECWNCAHLNSGPIEEQRKFLCQLALTKYAVNGLQGCLISVTGIAFDERAKICSMVQELGGIYSPELIADCSHLIFDGSASALSQSSQNHAIPVKVQYALKWGIPVVSKEWIYNCYAQRILLEESDYPASALENILIEEPNVEILPVRINEIKEGTPNFLHGCHIYLNGESISAQRLAVLKRLVLAAGGVRYTDLENDHLTHIVIHNQLLPNNLKVFLEQQQAAEFNQVKLVHDNWLFDSFKEGKRLSEDDYEVNKKKAPQTSKEREKVILPPQVQKWKSAFNPSNTSNANSSFLNANPNISFGNNTSLLGGDEFLAGTPNILESAAKILKGKTVYFLSNNSKLASKARKAEMKIVENELEADWCITGILITTDLYKKLTVHRPPNELKNEIWFEAALDSKSHLPSTSFSQPWHCASFPIPQASKFIISQSGFLGAEREFYADIIKLIGAQYTDNFSKTNTHLLIEEPRSGTKYEFAIKRKIECININWLKNFISKSIDTLDTRVFNENENSTVNNNNNNNFYIKPHSYNSFNSQLSKAKLSFQSVPENNSANYQPPPESKSEHISSLFKGLVFASSQRLWHRRDELSNMIESLGGIFLWSFDRTCTHYLHQGKLPDEAFKEFRQARQWDKFIVSPWWVVKSKESGERLDESQYPHTYKETGADESVADIKVDYEINKNSQSQPDNNAQQVNQSQPQQVNNSQPQTLNQSSNSLDWNAIMAERKAQEFLLKPGSKAFNIEAHSTFIKPAGGSQQPDLIKHQKYNIVFSGFTSTERAELIEIVTKRPDLKLAKEDEPVEWDRKKTILICNGISFTEKIFSACANGCWVLKKEFLFDESGNFEKYELGPSWNANDREILIGKAPKHWRQRISKAGNSQDVRPFVGWKCVLIVESSRQAVYESVLRNGGAEVFKYPFPADFVKEITHFFCANINSIPVEIRHHLKSEQVFSAKHITNTIFGLSD